MKDWIKKPLEFWRSLKEYNRITILLILITLLFAYAAWPMISSPG